MQLRTTALMCTLAGVSLSTATALAKGADDPSTEDAPFAPAGGGSKGGPAPFATSPSAGFAAVGQWVLSLRTTGDTGGFLFFHKDSPGDWSLSLHPEIDYFIINNLSVGGFIGFDFVTSGDNDSSRFSIGPRFGYNIPAGCHEKTVCRPGRRDVYRSCRGAEQSADTGSPAADIPNRR